MKITSWVHILNFYTLFTVVLLILFFSNTAFLYADLPLEHPKPWQLGFQLPASPIACGIFAFHDDLMVFLTFILFFVEKIFFEFTGRKNRSNYN